MKIPFYRLPILVLLAVFLLIQPVSADDQANADSTLRVEKIVICKGVDQRTPIGISNVFSVDSKKLFCFTKIVGATEKTVITHRWLLNGELKSTIQLPVESGSWRTWSAKQIDSSDAGDWMVEIVAENGEGLASIIFFVQ